MMKFVLQAVHDGCRCGLITEIGGKSQSIKTPMCLLYAPAGTPPYLTRDLLNKLGNAPPVMHTPVNTVSDKQSTYEAYKNGLSKLAAMDDYALYTSVQDSSQVIPSGYNDKSGVAMWGKGGKKKVNPIQYIQLQAALGPDLFQSLCDSDTNEKCKRKRVRKSVDRTLQFLDKCVTLKNESEKLKKSSMMGVVVGGYEEDERVRSAKETSKRATDGFVLEGFHSFGPNVDKFPYASIRHLVRASINVLPADKPRMLPGAWSPSAIIQAVRDGIDIFDSALPYITTERGHAFCFKNTFPLNDQSCDLTVKESMGNFPSHVADRCWSIDLNDAKYVSDFGTISRTCDCYCCASYSRSYIHHLLNTKELLGNILLMIHNFDHYFRFFVTLREAVLEHRLSELEEIFEIHV